MPFLHYTLAIEITDIFEWFQVLSDSSSCIHQDLFLHLSHKGYLSSAFENYSDDGWHCHSSGYMALAVKSLLVTQRHFKASAMWALRYLPLYRVKIMMVLKTVITVFSNIVLASAEPCRLGCSCRYPPCCCDRGHSPPAIAHRGLLHGLWHLKLQTSQTAGRLSFSFANCGLWIAISLHLCYSRQKWICSNIESKELDLSSYTERKIFKRSPTCQENLNICSLSIIVLQIPPVCEEDSRSVHRHAKPRMSHR